MSDRTETIKPVRIDLGDGDSLNLYRMSDYVTVVRFHGNNPNVQLSSAQVSTVALRAALDEVAPAGSYTRTDEDWKARAEKAEEERDHLATVLETTARQRDEADKRNARPLTPYAMTAREHLDAAWEAAHVPADGIIPEGRMFLDRGTAGVVVVGAAGNDLASRGSSWERRLVDPPTPARPEGAEEIEALLTGSYAEPRYVADFLAEHGVRVVTEEQQ